jgi:hypothetical protein
MTNGGGHMKIRIVHWNISWSGNIEKKIEFIKTHMNGDSILCLQEVQKANYESIIKELSPDFCT